MKRLDGRVAIVTGAANGIGKATAIAYAREGAIVAIVDVDAAGAAAMHELLAASGATVRVFPIDVREYDGMERACQSLLTEFGRVDILVNNAAVGHDEPFLSSTLEEWRRVLQVNLEAIYIASQLAARAMAPHGGRIVNISSIQAFMTTGRTSAYNAAKAGLLGLTRAMAVELAPQSIIVNAIAPGFVRAGLSIRPDGVDETTTSDFDQQYVRGRRIPLGRAGQPDEVAGVALFLASDDCQYMTGQTLVVDGGLSITI